MDPVGREPDAVRRMFDEIAPRYDLLNRLLSFGVDRRWRLAAARAALAKSPRRVLDVATGTGDLALLLKRLRPEAEVVGLDFSGEMIERARMKAARAGLSLTFVEGDALNPPFPPGSFEAITVTFGFRNFADYAAGLKSFHRLLAPGGRTVILDFPPPPKGAFGRLYTLYFERVLPFLGGVISGKPAAYRYLPETAKRFPRPEDFLRMMEAAGFAAEARPLTGGVAYLFVGEKDA